MIDLTGYAGKRVLVTGHTGFKGSWLCRTLLQAGAQVTGYALAPEQDVLFTRLDLKKDLQSIEGDVRDLDHLIQVAAACRPEIILHMAAQAIVREGYRDPVRTYETNVLGTVNILEAARRQGDVASIVNVTTDKVYRQREDGRPYREGDVLDGFDPYANSKSCAELVTRTYSRSFFAGGGPAVSTVRSGNVIGGGDLAPDRLLPDCVRAAWRGKTVTLRNPRGRRPYQHVLEAVAFYLQLAGLQQAIPAAAGSYNVGPREPAATNRQVVDRFLHHWNQRMPAQRLVDPATGAGTETGQAGPGDRQPDVGTEAWQEAAILELDTALARESLGWQTCWTLDQAIRETAEAAAVIYEGGDLRAHVDQRIHQYLQEAEPMTYRGREGGQDD